MARTTDDFTAYLVFEGTLAYINICMAILVRAGARPLGGAKFSRMSEPGPPGPMEPEPLFVQSVCGFAPHWADDGPHPLADLLD